MSLCSQSECAEGFSVPAAILTGEGGKLQQAGKMTASPVKELTKPENIDELKRLASYFTACCQITNNYFH